MSCSASSLHLRSFGLSSVTKTPSSISCWAREPKVVRLPRFGSSMSDRGGTSNCICLCTGGRDENSIVSALGSTTVLAPRLVLGLQKRSQTVPGGSANRAACDFLPVVRFSLLIEPPEWVLYHHGYRKSLSAQPGIPCSGTGHVLPSVASKGISFSRKNSSTASAVRTSYARALLADYRSISFDSKRTMSLISRRSS